MDLNEFKEKVESYNSGEEGSKDELVGMLENEVGRPAYECYVRFLTDSFKNIIECPLYSNGNLYISELGNERKVRLILKEEYISEIERCYGSVGEWTSIKMISGNEYIVECPINILMMSKNGVEKRDEMIYAWFSSRVEHIRFEEYKKMAKEDKKV